MFHQTFEPHDLLVICLLMVLEGLLSVDNALVLGLLAQRLPEEMRTKALTFGLVGSLIFRVVAIGAASALLRWHAAELLGGVFLLYIAIKHLLFSHDANAKAGPAVDHEGNPILKDEATGLPLTEEQLGEEMAEQTHGQIRSRELDYSTIHSTREIAFWIAVAWIELTDIIFAVDSIIAAIALVGPAPPGTPVGQMHPKLWVVIAGGMGGVILMRFAAMIFIKLLERFPRFDTSAYLLVMLIGVKMLADYFMNRDRRAPSVDFNNLREPWAWVFWGLMAAAVAFGFLPGTTTRERSTAGRH